MSEFALKLMEQMNAGRHACTVIHTVYRSQEAGGQRVPTRMAAC